MSKNRITIAITFLMALLTSVQAAEIKTEKQKLSYSLGAYFANGIAGQNIDMDVPAFIQAVEDILNKSELKLTDEEMQTALTNYQKQEQERRASIAVKNKSAGESYLAENKKKDGVVTLPSGLQYKVLKQGEGEKPAPGGNVTVNYHGTHIDGRVFDSSYDRGQPISLSLGQVIKGWQEVVPLMNVGSKYQVYIPSELAYGERGAGTIGPNETLVFDIELLSIN